MRGPFGLLYVILTVFPQDDVDRPPLWRLWGVASYRDGPNLCLE